MITTTEQAERLLEERNPKLPVDISFHCFGMPFSVRAAAGPDGLLLKLAGVVGHLPYSIESRFAREALSALLSRDPANCHAQLTLDRDHRIMVQGEMPLDGAATPARIVATAATIVASAKPLIELVQLYLPLFHVGPQPDNMMIKN